MSEFWKNGSGMWECPECGCMQEVNPTVLVICPNGGEPDKYQYCEDCNEKVMPMLYELLWEEFHKACHDLKNGC